MTQVTKLTKEQYKQGFELALENAKIHMSIASKIAETSYYGIAISHLILSLEELAKAAILKIKSIDESIEIKNLQGYFYNHLTKHKAIFKSYLTSLSETKSQPLDREDIEILAIVVLAVLFIFYILINERKNSFDFDLNKLRNDGFYFFGFDLNKLRNDGFYVDFDDTKNEWQTPSSVNEQSYNEVRNLTTNIFDSLESTLFADNINNENIDAFIATLSDENTLKKLKKHIKD